MNNSLVLSITIAFLFFSCSQNKTLLPAELFGLKLNNKITGTEAKNFIDDLHLQDVTPDNNEIGFYSGDSGSAVIYVTYYADLKTAVIEEKKMIDAIKPGNPVFFSADFVPVNGREVFRCFGMGQTHFVFSSQNILFWVSVDSHISRSFIEGYIKYVE